MKDFDNALTDFFNQLDQRISVHIPNMVSETAVEEFKDAFIKKSWDGVPWDPYKNKAREPRRGSLMMRSNALFNSIRPTLVSPTLVVINAGNSRVKYARAHNEGSRMSGTYTVRSYTNRNFMGRGRAVNIRSHARSVDYLMPRRQFMGKSQSLFNRITTRFNNSFNTF